VKKIKSKCIWLYGLSGAGKTTIANALKVKLQSLNVNVFILDGDIVRTGLCSDLGFSEIDRHENLRRISHLAKILVDADVFTIVSVISPYEKDRIFVKSLFNKNDLLLTYLSTPLEECERRDVKGLYKKARNGQIQNFTGISSPFETSSINDLSIDTSELSISESVDILLNKI
jgi:adenylyl-sulfate kinase